MEVERLRQIEEVYHAALELERDRRAGFVREACGTDESLRREVESLLAYRSQAEDFIEAPAMEVAAGALARDEVRQREIAETEYSGVAGRAPWMPDQIGRYRVIRLLGEGGMGVVYEAEQEQPRRIVALKVIKPGLASVEVLRRFELESLALARLQHTGIAQIYEAGTADAGFGPQPYFAMELIRGRSLREYAEEHRLNTRQRLELMVKICDAVQHAHQRGLIHRDLKPGNILVDETGQPKILDFGVARVTDSDAQATRQTDLGQMVGTLAYMSPEQVLADPLELDTRSDVYALGVILYELLAGRLPYKLSRQPHEAARTIRDEDPTRLSSVSRLYRGDIETIAAKALEKDKARRYASASGLAADIQRYLKDEPITARPPSATYQVRKFARRHKALVAGLAAVFAVLVAGIVASTWEATRARRAERMAEAVNDFLQNDLLAQASARAQARPDTKPDPDLKVRTALDRAAAQIQGKFQGQPLVEASIQQTIGKTYEDLGLYPDAQRHLERALDLRRRALGGEHSDTLSTMNDVADLLQYQGKYVQAEPLITKVLEVRRRVLGKEHLDTLNTMASLALLYRYQGKYPQAEPLFTKVLEVKRRVLGAEHIETLSAMNDLAILYWSQGKYAQAEPLYTKVLESRRSVLGAEHPATLTSMNNLALLYRYQGRYREAEPLYTKALELQRRVLGEEHPETLSIMNNLAVLYVFQGKYAQAGPLYSKVLELQRRVLGEEHPNTLASMNNLAVLYRDQGKYAQAEGLFTQVLKTRQRLLGKEHPDALITMDNLAVLYRKQGKYVEAERLSTEVLEKERRVLGGQSPGTLIGMGNLARVKLDQGKLAEAEPLLREALTGYAKTADTWRLPYSQSMLGASLAGQEKYAEAEAPLLSGYQGMLQREATIPAASRVELEQAGKWIVRLYQDWGKPRQAGEWREKLRVTKGSAAPSKP